MHVDALSSFALPGMEKLIYSNAKVSPDVEKQNISKPNKELSDIHKSI